MASFKKMMPYFCNDLSDFIHTTFASWLGIGSGCARGFLGSYDAIWMLRQWGKGLNSVLEVLAERESIYRLLAQTTPENLSKDHNQYRLVFTIESATFEKGDLSLNLVFFIMQH